MNRRRVLNFMTFAIASLLLITGLRFINSAPAMADTTLLVSAAASLKDALEEIKPLYQQSKPGIKITYNFGASGALLQQIEQGAPADIFISAAAKQMNTLQEKGMLVPGTRANLANNKLVLIVPRSSRGVTSFASLKQPAVRKIAIGEPRSVPAGQYAEQVLQTLKMYDALKPKFVYANNVRQVLAAVESGNADAGIVYLTDAKTSNKVKVAVTADDTYHAPIAYPMAVLKNSKNVNAAKDFVKYLASPSAKGVLKQYGFLVPTK